MLSLLGINLFAASIKDVDCEAFSKLITAPGVQLVDCRTAEEYAEGHIEGAILIDYKLSDFRKQALGRLDKGRNVAIYCRSGRRSCAAGEILAAEGYKIFNLQGGILSWTEEGYPTTTKTNDMARKNFGVKTYLYPQPVLIIGTYDENGTPDAMNAAWGGISESNRISICISEDHKTTKNLLKTGAFTVSMGTKSQMVACDYVGIVSGNDVPDKFARAGWHATKSTFVNAPLIDELPLAIECKLIGYNSETCILQGEIVNVAARDSILGEDGKIDPAKLEAISYDPVHHKYLVIGEAVGNAFSDGKQLK